MPSTFLESKSSCYSLPLTHVPHPSCSFPGPRAHCFCLRTHDVRVKGQIQVMMRIMRLPEFLALGLRSFSSALSICPATELELFRYVR